MSMIEEQIQKLEEIREELATNTEIDCDINDYAKKWAQNIDSAITTIKELSAKVASESMERSSRYCNGRWIPCSERTPESKINSVTNDAYAYLVTTDFENDVRYYKFWNGHWHHGAGIMDDHVIAWMSLPEPYKEAKNNAEN